MISTRPLSRAGSGLPITIGVCAASVESVTAGPDRLSVDTDADPTDDDKFLVGARVTTVDANGDADRGGNATSARAISGATTSGTSTASTRIDLVPFDEPWRRETTATGSARSLMRTPPAETTSSSTGTTRSSSSANRRTRWPAKHLTLVGFAILLLLSGCGDNGDLDASSSTTSIAAPAQLAPAADATPNATPAGPGAVTIVEFAFMPSPVTVRPGGTVTWTNNDDAAHSIADTSPMATPTSKSLNKGDTFSITYPQPGTYPYVCGIHNYMQGSVEVKA